MSPVRPGRARDTETRREVSRSSKAPVVWETMGVEKEERDWCRSRRFRLLTRPPLGGLARVPQLPPLLLGGLEERCHRPYFDTCAVLSDVSLGGATARKGGDSPNGLPLSPQAARCSLTPTQEPPPFANPAVRVSFPGSRARMEQCGRSIQRPRSFHASGRAARACSSPSSHRSARVVS